MRILLNILIFIVTITHVFYVQAHESSDDLYPVFSQSEKEVVETKLSKFLDRVDHFNADQQQRVYAILLERIKKALDHYETTSAEYNILHIVYTLLEHKLDIDTILSNGDILDHILYGKDYQHYFNMPAINIPIIEEPGENEDIETIVRHDLYTQALNEYEQDILAGTSGGIVSLGARSDLEPIQTETVIFKFNQNIDNMGLAGALYHNGILVDTSLSSKIQGDSMIFSNIANLVIPETTSYLQLELITENIGKNLVGEFIQDLTIVSVSLQDTKGTISGANSSNQTYSTPSQPFNIVPAKLDVVTESAFIARQNNARLKISYDDGGNNYNGDDLDPQITSLDILISSFDTSGAISVFNGNGTLIGSENINGSGRITISLTPDFISSRGEIYTIQTQAEAVFYIPQDGIIYTAGPYTIETKLGQQVYLGQR